MRYILRSLGSDSGSHLGGKARCLLLLLKVGFPVPDFFVVTPQAFGDSLTPAQRAAVESGPDPDTLRSALADLVTGSPVRRELAAALLGFDRTGALFAVRSSAADEDGAEHSFAGQLKSFLGVRPQEIAQRMVEVWKSGFSSTVCAYRAQQGLPWPPAAPAVIVQRMIAPDAAGVAFSADPVTGDRSLAVIASNYGLATSVVSGEADSDLHHVDRSGRILKRQIAIKTRADRVQAAAPDGVAPAAVATGQARRAALDDGQVRQVAEAVRRIETLFGSPQDVEWAIAGGRLHILQARPITALSLGSGAENVRQIWDNSNIVESYGGITTPLTFSFARRAYEGVYRQFCRTLRVPRSVIEANDSIFGRMLGRIRGRVYYNLLNWYRLIAMLPGYTLNRRFMEQMMGVKERLAESASEACARAPFHRRLLDALRLGVSVAGLTTNYLRLKSKSTAFQRRLENALRTSGTGLAGATPDQLVAAFRDLERRLLTRWDAPLVNDFFTMIFSGVLGRLCERWGLNVDGPVHQALLCSGGRMVSTEPARRIAEMARLAGADDDLLRFLQQEDGSDLMRRLRRFPEFRLKLRAYLERFGERCTDELKLESATLQENPLPLLRAIAALAVSPAAIFGGSHAMAADSATPGGSEEARAYAALSGRPLRRWVFSWVLKNARERVRTRENLRYERTRVFGRVRTIFLELGRRFHERGLLENPRDIFFLEVEEIFGFVQGYAAGTNLKGLVSLRRQEVDADARLEKPADRFETRGIVYHGNRFTVGSGRPADGNPAGDLRRGVGCGPGVASGRARVVMDPAAAHLEAGEILVAERTDPGWVMLFPLAAGLVVERGSLLSHSAIVAREMGIPTVVGLAGATAWLKTGDPVQVDGHAGCVRKMRAEASEDVHDLRN
jgi:pyruvate,water dikinase